MYNWYIGYVTKPVSRSLERISHNESFTFYFENRNLNMNRTKATFENGMLPVFVIRPFENGTSCSYYECVKDAQEHSSDGLVTDALMFRMFFFFCSTPGDWSLHI